MAELIRTVAIMSLSGSVLALLLFGLKPLVRGRLPKSAQYYLWLVVLAALLIPVSQIAALSDVNPLPVAPVHSTVDQVMEQFVIPGTVPNSPQPQLLQEQQAPVPEINLTPPVETTTPSRQPISAEMVFALVYALGVLFVLLYYIINYKVFISMHRRRNRPANEEELAILAELCGARRVPRLYHNPLAGTPMLIGLFRPAIILPDREYTHAQLRAVLRHELTHLRRKDVLVKWLSVLASAVHWFNPIVWLARREIDRACELACDEAVIRSLDVNGRQSYGDTLITVAADCKTPRAVLSTTMCEEKKTLKERLASIMKYKSKSKMILAVSVALIIVLSACGLVLGASSAYKPEPLAEIDDIVGNDQLLDTLGYSRDVLKAIADDKTPYVGDSSRVGAIINQLPIPWKGLPCDGFSLETDQEPYALTINYFTPDMQAITDYFDNPFAASIRENNALLLFSAIDNLSAVNNKNPDDMMQYSFTREQIREQFGEIPSVADIQALRELLSQNLRMDEFYFSHASRLYLGTSPEDAIYRMGGPLKITTLDNGMVRYAFLYAVCDYKDGKLWSRIHAAEENISYSDIISRFGQPLIEKGMSDSLLYILYPLRGSIYLDTDVYAYFLFETGKLIKEGVTAGQIDDDFSVPAGRADAALLADSFVEALNAGVDLTGDDSAMDSWREMFDFEQAPVVHSGLREVEYSENYYQFEVIGKNGGLTPEVSVYISLQDEEPQYFCPYTRYYPRARPVAETYLALLAEGDARKLAVWLSVDGGPDPSDDFVRQAEDALRRYSKCDLPTARVESVSYNNEQFFQCVVRDAEGVGYVVTLTYGDGLLMPQRSSNPAGPTALMQQLALDLWSQYIDITPYYEEIRYVEDNPATRLAMRWTDYRLAEIEKHPGMRLISIDSIESYALEPVVTLGGLLYVRGMSELRFTRADAETSGVNGVNVEFNLTIDTTGQTMKIIAIDMVFDSRYQGMKEEIARRANGGEPTISMIDAVVDAEIRNIQ